MQITIRSRPDALSPETRRALERRLRLTLGRRASRVERALITLAPCEQPEGSGLSHCRIRASLHAGEPVIVEDTATDASEAAARAAWRLEHLLDRQRVREMVMRLRD